MSVGRNSDYIYGSAVRQPSFEPDYYEDHREKRHDRQPAARRAQNSRRRSRNRVSARFTLFLLVSAVVVLLTCVSYLKVHIGVAGQKEAVGDLQTELASVKDENDTRYEAIMDSVDLDEIEERAESDLGMSAATSDQTINYDQSGSEYTKSGETASSGSSSATE